jgi:DNA polymerase-3 subunit chi
VSEIHFIKGRTAEEKLHAIIHTAKNHFDKKTFLLFYAHDKATIDYIDQLLWKSSSSYFLPHIVTDTPSKELLVITSRPVNLNGAQTLFNLSPGLPIFYPEFERVIEFFDTTSSQKKEISERKLEEYKKRGENILSLANL